MKKTRIAFALLAACASINSFAGNMYIGPALLLQQINATSSRYDAIHPRLSLGFSDTTMMDEQTWYFAGELFYIPTAKTLSDSQKGQPISAKVLKSYGATFIPGYVFSNGMTGYLRLGIINSKFIGPNVYKAGKQLGIGLKAPITKTFDLYGEYIFTSYRSEIGLGSARSNELGIGFQYNFI